MKKLAKIKHITKILVQRLLRLLRGRNGWKWASAGIVLLATLGPGLMHFTATQALTTSLYPNGDITKGWTITNNGTTPCTTTAGVHYTFIDENTGGCTDYVGTDTAVGTTGEVEEYDMTTVSVVSATQIQISVVVDSIIASTADTLSINLRVNGAAQTASTCTMGNTTSQTCTATYSGSWDQTAVDSMRVIITRNRLGTGPTGSQDDDIRIHRVFASLTYTAPVVYEQSTYRWFDGTNQDVPGVTFLKNVNDAAVTTSYVTGDGMATLSDGGYVTTGYLRNSGTGIDDALITRYDSSGTPIWSRTIGGPANEYARSVAVTSDGGIAVAGTTESNSNSGVSAPYVAKFDISGNLLWMRVLDGNGSGPDYAEAVASAGDGGVYFAGSSQSTGSGSSDVLVGRYDASGNLTWLKIMGGTNWDEGTAIAVVGDGVIIGGTTATYGTGSGAHDAFVAKFSTAGALQWMTYANINGSSSPLLVNDMVVTTNGSILIVGDTDSGPGGGLSDGYVAKFSSGGVFQWMYGIGTGGDDYTNSLVATSDGGAALAGSGSSYNINGDQDATLAKITDNGATSTLSWVTRLSNIADESGTSVTVASDGGYVMAGNSNIDGGSIVLGRFTSTGTISGCGIGTCDSVSPASAGYTLASVVTAAVSIAGVNVSTPSALTSNSVTPSISTKQAITTMSAGSSIDVGSPLGGAGLNAAATAPAEGSIFRLRLNLHVSGGPLNPGANSFKMQFANKGANALCSSVTTGSYTDITTSSTGLRYANYPNAGNGLSLTVNANDPTHGSDFIVRQSYQEGGVFTATSQIAVGQDGMWDFAFTAYHALEGTHYCLRMVDSNGNLLNTYTQYPEIIMPSAVLGQASYRWFGSNGSDSTFAKAYGASTEDAIRDIAQTSDGGFVAAGYTSNPSAGGTDAMIAKYDASGNLSWSQRLGGTGDDTAYGIAVTTDNYYVITGITNSYGTGGDAFVAKYDTNGTYQWMKTLGGANYETANDILAIASGGFVITGATETYGVSLSYDVFVAQYNSSGVLSWMETAGGSGTDIGNSIVANPTGGYIVAGETWSYGSGGGDAFFLTISSIGTVTAMRTLGGSSSDWAYSVAPTADSGFVIVGHTQSYAGFSDAFIAKFNSSKTLVWMKTLSGPAGNDYAHDVITTADGGYMITGEVQLGVSSGDAFLTKVDSSGSVVWTKTLGGGNQEISYAVAATLGGGFVIGGYTGSYGISGDVLLAVYDSSGTINGCTSACNSPTPTVTSPTPGSTSPSPTTSSPSPGTGTPSPVTASITTFNTTVIAGGVSVGSALAATNIPYDADTTRPLALRINVAVDTSGIALGNSYKLQFADQGGAASCAAVSGGSYGDVTAGTAVYYYDDPAFASGANLLASANDPVDAGRTNIPQTYQEANPFSTFTNVYAGQNATWQFSLAIQNGSPKGKAYCLRIVKSTGFTLDAYSNYGEIAYAPTMARLMKGGKWFDHSGVKRSLAL